MPDPDDTAYCADSCGRPATTERLVGVLTGPGDDLTELVELVCAECERAVSR